MAFISRLRFFSILFLALAWMGPALAQAADEGPTAPGAPVSVEDAYRLGTGDKVRVIVFGEARSM